MARFYPGGNMGGAVGDLEGIGHVLARFYLCPRPRPPAELPGTQQPGRAKGHGTNTQAVKRPVDRFVGQMPAGFSRKPFLQRPANLLRAPPLRQALHNIDAQVIVAGDLGQPRSRASPLRQLWARKG